jgi:hypothetical protein
MPCNVQEDFLVGVKCEWEKESIFLEICTGHFPAQGLETIPDHCATLTVEAWKGFHLLT